MIQVHVQERSNSYAPVLVQKTQQKKIRFVRTIKNDPVKRRKAIKIDIGDFSFIINNFARTFFVSSTFSIVLHVPLTFNQLNSIYRFQFQCVIHNFSYFVLLLTIKFD